MLYIRKLIMNFREPNLKLASVLRQPSAFTYAKNTQRNQQRDRVSISN